MVHSVSPGLGDQAFGLRTHSALGAVEYYHPGNGNDVVNRGLISGRLVAEHQNGRIGVIWKQCSDNAGNWTRVGECAFAVFSTRTCLSDAGWRAGNGGIKGRGSAKGMAACTKTFVVCTRLTAMVQRMRGEYPRNPRKFFAGRFEQWELELARRHLLELGN